jgi:chromosome segregation ATPase
MIANLVVTLASLSILSGACSYKFGNPEEENKNQREQWRRELRERDKKIRDQLHDTAKFVHTETPRLMTVIQNTQKQFSELVTALGASINEGEHGNQALQNITRLLKDHLSDLTTLTTEFESQLPNSRERLATLNSELSATSTALTDNQNNLSKAVENIHCLSPKLRRVAELIKGRDSNVDIIKITQQNRDYKTNIESLQKQVEEQSKMIMDLELKLLEYL